MEKAERYADLARMPVGVRTVIREHLTPVDASGYEWRWVEGTRSKEGKAALVEKWLARFGGRLTASEEGVRVSSAASSRMFAYWTFTREKGGLDAPVEVQGGDPEVGRNEREDGGEVLPGR